MHVLLNTYKSKISLSILIIFGLFLINKQIHLIQDSHSISNSCKAKTEKHIHAKADHTDCDLCKSSNNTFNLTLLHENFCSDVLLTLKGKTFYVINFVFVKEVFVFNKPPPYV